MAKGSNSVIPPHTFRRPLTYAALSTLALLALSFGASSYLVNLYPELNVPWNRRKGSDPSSTLPNFGRYNPLITLDADEFPINDPERRTIIVGDVHGMYPFFQDLLEHVEYSPSTDVLIHAGDISAKGPLGGSLETLRYMTRHNITGVRGNHDQKVVEWRGWIEWLETLPGGQAWLEDLEHRWDKEEDSDDPLPLKKFLKRQKKKALRRHKKFWKLIPDKWKILADHYQVARAMSPEEFQYLLDLPLRLYVPSAHAFIAHAGMLPLDPRYPDNDPEKQPLARTPAFPDPEQGKKPGPQVSLQNRDEFSMGPVRDLRYLQEISLLTEIPQNLDPWVLLNMRSVLRDGTVTRNGDKGTPWSDVWRRAMSSCVGFQQDHLKSKDHVNLAHQRMELPCYPLSIIYGHAATRGLDLKRWSTGLDSACVRQGRLSALVIGGKDNVANEANLSLAEDVTTYYYKHYLDKSSLGDKTKERPFRFGDGSRAHIASVRCK